ncbi:Sar s 3 allergen (serine protease-like protein 8) [Sarcoptes scabiei]|uniref:Sar s 3 allergen (Serine protease-like protein 8) n=1 Tax=Sarcoptes scabiei TaxID=52283 RepID=A0A132ALE5_SARSC|nr:Sar s 3 allergen (serine protease-like protein 8) [Sarcoptes scabiei]
MVSTRSRLFVSFSIALASIFPLPSLTLRGDEVRKIEITDAPWSAAVTSASIVCGGSILSDSFVLTSARCVFEKPLSGIKVHYGSKEISSVGIYESVKAVHFIRFKPTTLENNIALLETSGKLQLDGQKSKAIPLTSLMFDPAAGSKILVSGWGAPGRGPYTNYSDLLLAANFTVIGREDCREQF